MMIKDIKKFCPVCGNLYDRGNFQKCVNCKCKLVEVRNYNQEFSEFNGVYTLKLNV